MRGLEPSRSTNTAHERSRAYRPIVESRMYT